MTLLEFMEDVILRDLTDAQSIVFPVAALALHTNIDIVVIDVHDQKNVRLLLSLVAKAQCI